MNQNTTVETIRSAIGKITRSLTHCRDLETSLPLLREARSALCRLANRLEAAPQPPVEQSEPRHQLFAGMIHGLYKEPTEGRWIKWQGTPFCPHCDHPYSVESRKRGVADCCCENCGANAKTIVLAPPAVIEPEPELDEFEQWAQSEIDDEECNNIEHRMGVEFALEKYREIISRKGDK